MEIKTPEAKLTMEVTLGEMRIIEYALRNVNEEEFKDAERMSLDIAIVLKSNGVELIEGKDEEIKDFDIPIEKGGIEILT